ncbi:HAMP domain-containing sensor histidine kinase [uncultured Fusobacterium sp.]|uniref:HAMP domain-containing sensor histidine kinase n=1 Tax=uncultured Fusobacterium sp. TaxID=159267 RepID=UPI0027DC2445|nr:HAMP domain-containing sensor histidine kinase [uncultured Fusobacterium sp.]
MKIKINFFQKIFIFSVFIVIFTVLTGYILNIFFLDDFYVYRKKEKMIEAVNISKSLVNDEEIFKEYVEDLRDKEGIDIAVFKKNSMHKMRGRREDMHNNNSPPPTGFNVTSISKTNIKLLIYNEPLPDGRILTLRTSLSVMSAHKHEMYVFNILTTITSVLLSMIIGRIFSKQITKNIKKLNRVAGKISVLDFSEKAEIESGDEMEELSQSIDKMSENLSLSIENLRAFASNASHELRTPITVISTYAQALINGIVKSDNEKSKYYKAIAKESMDMNELVGNLLTISRLSSPGIKLNMAENNILSILKQSIEKYEMLELEKDIEWNIKLKEEKVFCDIKIFKIAFDNIIQNALKYSKENDIISVYKVNERICIENSIDGRSTGDTSKLWEPFSRGDNANELSIEGNGLGLSIVKKIMELNKIPCGINLKDKKFTFWFDILRS